jgi:glycosyltransferase involved in cell wall biosynthesis
LSNFGIETVFLFNEKSRGYVPFDDFECRLVRHIQPFSRRYPVISFLLFLVWLPWNIIALCRTIRSRGIDIVHTNGLTNIVPAMAAKLMRRKVLWHLNDTLTPVLVRRLFVPLVAVLSDRIALAARAVGEYYLGATSRLRKKSTVLYAPVDTKEFDRANVDSQRTGQLKKELGLSPDARIVGAIGNINRAKGYEYFVKAAALITRTLPDTRFVIVGRQLDSQGPVYDRLCDLIRAEGLDDKVLPAGFRDDIPDILSMFDVLVLSSVTEACPIVVLEAMAMKVPVVATRVGGVPEQIADNDSGIIVEPGRPDLLAEAVVKILTQPESDTHRMVEKAHRTAESVFSLDVIAEAHRQAYADVFN